MATAGWKVTRRYMAGGSALQVQKSYAVAIALILKPDKSGTTRGLRMKYWRSMSAGMNWTMVPLAFFGLVGAFVLLLIFKFTANTERARLRDEVHRFLGP